MRARVPVVVGLSLCLASPLSAQPTDPPPAEEEAAPVKDPKQAKRWQQTGATLVKKGDARARRNADEAKVQYENARTAYEKAIQFGADASAAYELALVLDKLGKHDEAYQQLRALAKEDSGAQPDVMKKASTKADEISMKIGLVLLVVKPEGATISIAGTEVGRAPLAEPLALMPGQYTIAFAADGFQPKQTEINVEGGSESERTIELEPIPVTVVPPAAPPQDEPVAPPRVIGPSKVPLFVGGGAAIALFGAATATGLMARSEHDTFTSQASTPDERADAQARGKKLALVTDLCLVGGVAAVGFTAYWYFAKYRSASAESAAETAKLDVLPWVQGDGGGFAVAGSF